ncbi:MAG TPA: hypothetical protein VJU58_04090 [Microbacterium sp.]|nr:hypothetical protein [Microbacterium sp.]
MSIAWTKLEVPLGAGLDTKGDIRAGRPPKLDIARDVTFGEPGGVQLRFPFSTFSNQIFGGGTLTNCRRLAIVNDELCVFTDTTLYSWNAQLQKWVSRGTHLAVSVNETPRFATTDDQIDPDRAELSGTVIYAWAVNMSGGGVGAYVAAIDKTTGATLMAPTLVPNVFRPRLVALATKILLFAHDLTNGFGVIALDPASPATGLAGGFTSVLAGVGNLYYDVVKAGTQDLCVGAIRRTVTTSYTVFTISPTLVITGAQKGRTCDGPIAVCATPDGTQVQIIRAVANGGANTNIQGDLLTTSTLADVFTGQAVGTAANAVSGLNQIAAAFSSTAVGGNFTAHAFWSCLESADGTTVGFLTKKNTVTTANVIGTQANFVLSLGIGSRAFDCNGSVYLWLAFACDSAASGFGVALGIRAQLQNTYFLYRSDAVLMSKAAFDNGGGYRANTGHLPSVVATSITGLDFAWCGTKRRTIELGGNNHTGFQARVAMDIAFSFDDNSARRVAGIGRTLYVAAGIPLQYDGTSLFEVGFLIHPFTFFVAVSAGGGSLPVGAYAYKSTLRWVNGHGEQERSTTAAGFLATIGTPNSFVTINSYSLKVTLKTAPRTAPAIELWRTPVNPSDGGPYYLITSKDPSVLVGSNYYIANDPTALTVGGAFTDNFTDAVLATKELNPENGAVLESLAPPGAKIIIATDTRLFLAGIAGDPDSVWYSRERGDGEVASFHDTLTVPVPRAGGDITALAFNSETLTVFRESAIYALPGDGLNNLGQGSNYGPARTISRDVGAVSRESVALTPLGLVFKSMKGWYLLTPAWQLRYIGAAVNAFDNDTVNAVTVVESEHHVRILTNARLILWDYSVVTEESPLGQWGEWTLSTGLDALMWRGQYVVLTATGPTAQLTTYTGGTYGLDVETTWLKPAEQQGEFFLRWIAALGEYRSAHLLRIRLARDYTYDGAGNPVYFDDFAWTPSPTVAGSALQVKHAPSINRMQALKVRLTAVTESTRAQLVTTTLSPQVATSGTVWNATWLAVSTLPGLMGNAVTMSLAFESGTANLIDVRDHYAYSGNRWVEDLNNIGVRVVRSSSPPTVAQLEAAIASGTTGTKLATLNAADATPSKTINISMAGQTPTGSFVGGAYGTPTGEALKLTSLAMEIGVNPGVNKRLPASQKAA